MMGISEDKKCTDQKLIVSLTSYPARIGTVELVLDTIYKQSYPADEIILWLAEEQFPEKEKELPGNLCKLIAEKRLMLKWCEDLKPHKKYFYAMQEYPNDLIVTIDDDVLYPEYLLENLYQSYLRHPNAVSAMRTHLMVLNENGKIMQYKDWIKETDVCLDEPSMQLFATGVCGVLYPAELFQKELFDKDAIMESCLWADDLWLKAIELVSDIPVVLCHSFEEIKYIPGTQKNGLYHKNEIGNQNDEQLAKINEWMNRNIEQDILIKKLTASDRGIKIQGVQALCEHFGRERAAYRQKIHNLNQKLQKTYAEKSEINAKLQRTYFEKSEINQKLQKTYGEKAEINQKLQKAYAEKSERGIRIKELENQVALLKAELDAEKSKSRKQKKILPIKNLFHNLHK